MNSKLVHYQLPIQSSDRESENVCEEKKHKYVKELHKMTCDVNTIK